MKKILLILSIMTLTVLAGVTVSANSVSELVNTVEKREAYFEVYGQEEKAPVTINDAGEERISTSEGTLSLSSTDLSLPGKAGFDLNITRRYNSNEMYDEEDGYIQLHSISNQTINEHHETVDYVYQYYLENDEAKTPVYIAFEDEDEMLRRESDGKIYTSSNYIENKITNWKNSGEKYHFTIAKTGTVDFEFKDEFYYARSLPEGNDVVLVREKELTPDELWLYTIGCYGYSTYYHTGKARISDGWSIEYPDFNVSKKEIKLVGTLEDEDINDTASLKNKRVHLSGSFSDPETGIMLGFSLIYRDRIEVEDKSYSDFLLINSKIGILKDSMGAVDETDMYTITMTKSYYDVDLDNEEDYNIIVTRYDGVKFFFIGGGNEKIVKKTDRFGNTVKYLGWSDGRDGFIDTYGRRIDFDYIQGKISAIRVDGQVYVTYENIIENDSVKDPDNKYVSDNIHIFKVTKGFDDIENNTVTYKGRYRYNTWDLGNDLNGKGAIPTFSGLTYNIEEIILPTGGKVKYSYEEKKYLIPKMEAISRDRIRVVSREEYTDDNSLPVNKINYTYDQTDMHNRVATTCKDGTDYEYREIYNRRSQLIKTEEKISGGIKETTYSYLKTLEKNELPEQIITKIYKSQDDNNPLVTAVNYEYNSCQQPVTESDGLQTKKSSYGANGIKISEEVYQSSGKLIRTYNTLNAENTAVIKTQIQSKGTNASTYTTEEETNYMYNEFGEVTKATKSGETEEDNRVTEINYEYLPFDTSNPDKNTLVKTTTVKDVSNISNELVDVSLTEYYNYFGNVYKTIDGNGGITTVIYDSLQRPVKNIYPDNTFETVSYNQIENDITLTDKNGTVQKIDYDGLGRQKAVYIDGEIVSSVTYTPHSLPETKNVYSEGNTVKSTMKYEYYSDGQPESEEIYEGNKLLSKAEYSYSFTEDTSVNEIKLYKTASDIINITQISDKYGRVTEEKTGDRTRSITYDIMGNVTSDKDYMGNVTTYSYDYANRPLKTTDALGNAESITYNKFGEQKTVTDKEGNTTTFEYNKMGKVTEALSPSLSKIIYYYDKNGNLTEQHTQDNLPGEEETFKKTKTYYDSMNRPVIIVGDNENVDNITKYVYDNNGNVLKTVTGLTGLEEEENSNIHQITSFSYNNLNMPVCITYPDGLSVTNTYDKLGNVLTTTDKSGTVTVYNYDGLGQLLDITATDNDKEEKISYTYDLMGNMLSMTDSSGITEYEYDNYCMPVKESKDAVLKVYSYDKNGNRTSFMLSVDGEQKISLSYGFDDLNRLTSVSGNGTSASYTYDKTGKLKKEVTNGVTTNYLYNADSLLTSKTNEYNGSSDIYGVTYYKDGNIASITENNKPTVSYTYDKLGRLTKETVENESITTYSYDNLQNRIRKIKEDTLGNILSDTGYTYGKNNLLLKETELSGNKEIISTYKYDKDGNTLSKTIAEFGSEYEGQNVSISEGVGNSFVYEYDSLNRLIRANHDNFSSVYTYDGNGLRQSKTVNGITTSHIYDGQNIVMDKKDGENQLYIKGVHLIARNENGSHQYYAFNVHGDTVMLTNQNGYTIKDYSYDAFGNQKTENENDTNPFRYSGEYFDLETGLIYLRARYYDTASGRFISEDPIKDGLNWYVYCGNNPIMFVDPLGLEYSWIREFGDVVWDEETSTAYLTIADETHEYRVEEGGTTFIENGKMYVDDQQLHKDFQSDRAHAIIYAVNASYYVNKEYPFYSNNCTNYVSQCLVAGGMQTDRQWNVKKGFTRNGWDYNPTVAWGTANGLYNYLVKVKGFKVSGYIAKGNMVSSIANQVQPGDIVFWDKYDYSDPNLRKGEMNHAGFVTKVENGEIYYCGNSNPRRNFPLSGTYDNGDVYIIRIQY